MVHYDGCRTGLDYRGTMQEGSITMWWCFMGLCCAGQTYMTTTHTHSTNLPRPARWKEAVKEASDEADSKMEAVYTQPMVWPLLLLSDLFHSWDPGFNSVWCFVLARSLGPKREVYRHIMWLSQLYKSRRMSSKTSFLTFIADKSNIWAEIVL